MLHNVLHLFHSANALALLGDVIQVLILGVVCFYAKETWRLRKLERAQVEASQKPCIVLYQTERPATEAAMAQYGVIGDRLVHRLEGHLGLQNCGAGPALKVLWEVHFGPQGSAEFGSIKRGTTPIIPADMSPCRISHVASTEALARGEIYVKYQSLSGASYQSMSIVRAGVIIVTEFSELKEGYEFPPKETFEFLRAPRNLFPEN